MNKFYMFYRARYWYSFWVVGASFLLGVIFSALVFLFA